MGAYTARRHTAEFVNIVTKQLKLDPTKREGQVTHGTLNESRSIREWENIDSPLEIRFYALLGVLSKKPEIGKSSTNDIGITETREDNVISWLKKLQVPQAAGTYNHPVQNAFHMLPENLKKHMGDGLLKRLYNGQWQRQPAFRRRASQV